MKPMEMEEYHGCKTDSSDRVLCRDDHGGRSLTQVCIFGGRVCSRRPECRPLADRLCLWYVLFFGSCVCRIRRTVRMEVWNFDDLGRHRKRRDRKPSCLGNPGKTHPHHDASSEGFDHAGFLRKEIQQQRHPHRGVRHCVHFPDSLYCFALSRVFCPARADS